MTTKNRQAVVCYIKGTAYYYLSKPKLPTADYKSYAAKW